MYFFIIICETSSLAAELIAQTQWAPTTRSSQHVDTVKIEKASGNHPQKSISLLENLRFECYQVNCNPGSISEN